KWKGITHIWHVHEMIVHPPSVKRLFPMLLRLLADKVACNSNATLRLLLSSEPSLSGKSVVIWNGIERKGPIRAQPALRRRLGLGSDKVLVVLAGRINRWKGQGLLVEAAEILRSRGVSNAHFLIIGSHPPGQEHFLESLKRKIATSSAKDDITVMDFTDDIWDVWDSCDIAAVPSTEPEPFGMVALEAMISGKPVVAASHGGLTDIVADSFTGFLFEPSNAAALANCVEILVKDGEKRRSFGQNGRTRALESFSLGQYVSSFSDLYRNA
ncbi:partial D-inositol 3-phosphate glycosyltransferase, partial [Anaerolineae bacterium]